MRISGATYPGVPHAVLRPELSTGLAKPKSAIFMYAFSSSEDRRMFSGCAVQGRVRTEAP